MERLRAAEHGIKAPCTSIDPGGTLLAGTAA
jgi:hypothetical protein